jgi:hypothetical protein
MIVPPGRTPVHAVAVPISRARFGPTPAVGSQRPEHGLQAVASGQENVTANASASLRRARASWWRPA